MEVLLHFLIVLLAIFLGIRLGGIAIGYAGGLGVIVLGLVFGLPVDTKMIPWDVVLIIMAVISAISAMQLAGGLDYLVIVAERILRSQPKLINFLAPTVTYFLAIVAGTGHTTFSMLPVIVEIAKDENIKPKAPLSLAVVSSQLAITASPVSAAVVYMTGVLEPFGWSYPTLILLWLVTTYLACMVTALIITKFTDLDLAKDPIYQEWLAKNIIKSPKDPATLVITKEGKLSVYLFLAGVLCVVLYSTAISKIGGEPVLIENVLVNRDSAIIGIMLSIATLIVALCKINPNKITSTSVFKSGMVAAVCVIGVAWLGTVFVTHYQDAVKIIAVHWVSSIPELLAVVYFFAATLLYSQAATAKAITPVVITALGISPADPSNSYMIVCSFAAVSALFVLPTYPTLLGAVQMDDTGTTRIGKFVFNHPFFLPGVLAIAFSVIFAFVLVTVI